MTNNFNILKFYLLKMKKDLVFIVLLAFFVALCHALLPYFIGVCIDLFDVFIDEKTVEYGTVILNIFVILFIVIFGTIFTYFFDVLCNLTVEKITKNIKDDCFKKVNRLPLSYIDSHFHGDIMSNLINDTDFVNSALQSFLRQFLEGFLTIFLTIIFMFFINWMLGIVVLLLCPFSFYVSFFVARKSNKHFKKQIMMQGEVSGVVVENFNNIELLQSFNFENEALDHFKDENHRYYVAGQKAQLYSSFTNPSTRLINNIVYAVVGLCGAILCIYSYPYSFQLLGATCTIGVLSTFLQYANQFAKPFNEMSSTIHQIQQGYQSLNQINALMNSEEYVENSVVSLENRVESIDFSNIIFSYDNKEVVINNLNLEIKKGLKVAIVGPTGSGKTTLINLLLRFYDVTFGKILINGEDVKKYSKKSLRDKFGLVLQDSWIFEGTVYDNIAFCKDDATYDEVVEASKKTHSYDFISHLPNGFNTIIKNDSGLSEGEKQLISLTRLMLLNPEIVILDEATSNIDSRSEVKIVNAFNELMKNKTSIVIAHRLSTIRNSDLILVVKDGKIVEQGNHKTLLKKNGFYKELYDAQFAD